MRTFVPLKLRRNRRKSARRRSRRDRAGYRRDLFFESLESRRLLSATVLTNATASFSQGSFGGFPVSQTIDGIFTSFNGWAIDPNEVDQTAVYEFASNPAGASGTVFTFVMTQNQGNFHTLGRFRFSVTGDDPNTFADGLQTGGDVTANWTELNPLTAVATNGTLLTIQGDNSILASGPNPDTSVYTVTAIGLLSNVTGLRLEVLEDPSLPNFGPGRQPSNGNFTLSELQVDAVPNAVANDPPMAFDDSITLDEGATATVLDGGATSLLDNDTDPNLPADTLAVNTTPVSGPSHGVLTLNANGTFSYAHNGSENFSDSFVYEISDNAGAPSTATVTITINPVNDNTPSANDDAATVTNGGTVTMLASAQTSLLANDFDLDVPNDTLTVNTTPVSGPANGSITLFANGTFSYTHNGSATYTDTIVYEVHDAASHTATATLTITINDPPTAVDDYVSTDESTVLSIGAPGMLANDTDPDSIDTLTVAEINGQPFLPGIAIALPSGALLTLNADDGSFQYDPNGAFDLGFGEQAQDTFTYTASDGRGGTDEATVNVTITNSQFERADLRLISADISFSPVNPDPAELVTISADITNAGFTDVTVPFTVRFFDFGVPIGDATISSLDAGATTTVSVQTSFPVEGYRLISVTSDVDGLISETNETNNEAALVLQVGQPATPAALIEVSVNSATVDEGQPIAITGTAFYDFDTVPGTQDFPVQGGQVTIEVLDSMTLEVVSAFSGAHTTVFGDYSQMIVAPLTDGIYTLRARVTDQTATGIALGTLTVNDTVTPPPFVPPAADTPPPPPPSEPDPTTDEFGDGGCIDCGGGGVGGGGDGGPLVNNNVFVFSDNIFFSNPNPAIGEEIFVFAYINFSGTDDPVAPFTVKLNDIFPVAGALETFTMGVTLTGFPAGASSSPKAVVFPYINTAEGAHIMQVDTTPPAAKNSTTLDDDATRLIVVGTPPAAVDIEKVGKFLNDADGNGIITPGDTIKYTIVATNFGAADLTGARVFDDFDETLVGSPVNVTGGGTINPGSIVWNLGDLLAGQSVTLMYEVPILASVDEDALLANIAMLTTDQTPTIFDNTRVPIHVNDAPTADDATFAVDENQPAGTVVGTVEASDPDNASTSYGTLSYAIAAGDPGNLFDIDSSGNITTTAPLDHEATDQHVLTVEVTDGGGLSDTAIVTINVNDLNENPIGDAEILGLVWEDFNNDGQVNFGEKAIAGVTIHLTGIDDLGDSVSQTQQTDTDGFYLFFDLRPGVYTVSEAQPAGFDDGQDVLGTVDGLSSGIVSANDVFSEIVLAASSVGENYNFGERPLAEGGVVAGQTATIGYWQNNNGQALLESLNGGASSTQLSSWLASSFSNMYGANAGANNLTDFDNGDVADFYTTLFRRKKKEALQLGLGGPIKTDAQVMAVAFATYVTNETLAGTTATAYGFLVTELGVGARTFNVGAAGAAFDVANNTDVAILDLLFATNEHSVNGVLYDEDGDGDADDDWETVLRTLANDVYSAINEQGDIL